MKNFRRILSMLLAVLMVTALLPVSALADSASFWGFGDGDEESIVELPDEDLFEMDPVEIIAEDESTAIGEVLPLEEAETAQVQTAGEPVGTADKTEKVGDTTYSYYKNLRIDRGAPDYVLTDTINDGNTYLIAKKGSGSNHALFYYYDYIDSSYKYVRIPYKDRVVTNFIAETNFNYGKEKGYISQSTLLGTDSITLDKYEFVINGTNDCFTIKSLGASTDTTSNYLEHILYKTGLIYFATNDSDATKFKMKSTYDLGWSANTFTISKYRQAVVDYAKTETDAFTSKGRLMDYSGYLCYHENSQNTDDSTLMFFEKSATKDYALDIIYNGESSDSYVVGAKKGDAVSLQLGTNVTTNAYETDLGAVSWEIASDTSSTGATISSAGVLNFPANKYGKVTVRAKRLLTGTSYYVYDQVTVENVEGAEVFRYVGKPTTADKGTDYVILSNKTGATANTLKNDNGTVSSASISLFNDADDVPYVMAPSTSEIWKIYARGYHVPALGTGETTLEFSISNASYNNTKYYLAYSSNKIQLKTYAYYVDNYRFSYTTSQKVNDADDMLNFNLSGNGISTSSVYTMTWYNSAWYLAIYQSNTPPPMPVNVYYFKKTALPVEKEIDGYTKDDSNKYTPVISIADDFDNDLNASTTTVDSTSYPTYKVLAGSGVTLQLSEKTGPTGLSGIGATEWEVTSDTSGVITSISNSGLVTFSGVKGSATVTMYRMYGVKKIYTTITLTNLSDYETATTADETTIGYSPVISVDDTVFDNDLNTSTTTLDSTSYSTYKVLAGSGVTLQLSEKTPTSIAGFSAVKWIVSDTNNVISNDTIADGSPATVTFSGTRNTATVTMYRTYGIKKFCETITLSNLSDYEDATNNTIGSYTPNIVVADSWDNDIDGTYDENLDVAEYKIVSASSTTLNLYDGDVDDATGMSTATWSSSDTTVATVNASTGEVSYKANKQNTSVTITMTRTYGIKKVTATITISNLSDYVEPNATELTELNKLYIPVIEVTDAYDNNGNNDITEKLDTYDTTNDYKVIVGGSVPLSEKAGCVKKQNLTALGASAQWSVETGKSASVTDAGVATFNGAAGTSAIVTMYRTYGIYKVSDAVKVTTQGYDTESVISGYTPNILVKDLFDNNHDGDKTDLYDCDTYKIIGSAEIELSDGGTVIPSGSTVSWAVTDGSANASVDANGVVTYNGAQGTTATITMYRTYGLKKVSSTIVISNLSAYEEPTSVGSYTPNIVVADSWDNDIDGVYDEYLDVAEYKIVTSNGATINLSDSDATDANTVGMSTATWSSSNTDIAEVSSTGVVTYKGAQGTSAIISMTRTYGVNKVTATITISNLSDYQVPTADELTKLNELYIPVLEVTDKYDNNGNRDITEKLSTATYKVIVGGSVPLSEQAGCVKKSNLSALSDTQWSVETGKGASITPAGVATFNGAAGTSATVTMYRTYGIYKVSDAVTVTTQNYDTTSALSDNYAPSIVVEDKFDNNLNGDKTDKVGNNPYKIIASGETTLNLFDGDATDAPAGSVISWAVTDGSANASVNSSTGVVTYTGAQGTTATITMYRTFGLKKVSSTIVISNLSAYEEVTSIEDKYTPSIKVLDAYDNDNNNSTTYLEPATYTVAVGGSLELSEATAPSGLTGISDVKWVITDTDGIINEESLTDGSPKTITFNNNTGSATIRMYRIYETKLIYDEITITSVDYTSETTYKDYTANILVGDKYDNNYNGVKEENVDFEEYKVVVASGKTDTLVLTEDSTNVPASLTGFSAVKWVITDTNGIINEESLTDGSSATITINGNTGSATITMYRTYGLKKISSTIKITNLADYDKVTSIKDVYTPVIEVTDAYDNNENGNTTEKLDTYDASTAYTALAGGTIVLNEKTAPADAIKGNFSDVTWLKVSGDDIIDSISAGTVKFKNAVGSATIRMYRTLGTKLIYDEIKVTTVSGYTEVNTYSTYTASITVDDSKYDNDLNPATTVSEEATYYVVAVSADTLQLSEKTAPSGLANIGDIVWTKVSGDNIFTSVGTDGKLTFNGTKGTAKIKMARTIGLKVVYDEVTIVNQDYNSVASITNTATDPDTVLYSAGITVTDANNIGESNGDGKYKVAAINGNTIVLSESTSNDSSVNGKIGSLTWKEVSDPNNILSVSNGTVTFTGVQGTATIEMSRIYGIYKISAQIEITNSSFTPLTSMDGYTPAINVVDSYDNDYDGDITDTIAFANDVAAEYKVFAAASDNAQITLSEATAPTKDGFSAVQWEIKADANSIIKEVTADGDVKFNGNKGEATITMFRTYGTNKIYKDIKVTNLENRIAKTDAITGKYTPNIKLVDIYDFNGNGNFAEIITGATYTAIIGGSVDLDEENAPVGLTGISDPVWTKKSGDATVNSSTGVVTFTNTAGTSKVRMSRTYAIYEIYDEIDITTQDYTTGIDGYTPNILIEDLFDNNNNGSKTDLYDCDTYKINATSNTTLNLSDGDDTHAPSGSTISWAVTSGTSNATVTPATGIVTYKGSQGTYATITMYRTYGLKRASTTITISNQSTYEEQTSVGSYTPNIVVEDSWDNDIDGVYDENLDVNEYYIVTSNAETINLSDSDATDANTVGMSTATWSSSNTNVATVNATTGVVSYKANKQNTSVTITMTRTYGINKVTATIEISNLSDYQVPNADELTELNKLYNPVLEVTDVYDNNENGNTTEKLSTYDTETAYKVLVKGSVQLSEKDDCVKKQNLTKLSDTKWSIETGKNASITTAGVATFNGAAGTSAIVTMYRTYGIYKVSDAVKVTTQDYDTTAFSNYTPDILVVDIFDNDLDGYKNDTVDFDEYEIIATGNTTLNLSDEDSTNAPTGSTLSWDVTGNSSNATVDANGVVTYKGAKGTNATITMYRTLGLRRVSTTIKITRRSDYKQATGDDLTKINALYTPVIEITDTYDNNENGNITEKLDTFTDNTYKVLINGQLTLNDKNATGATEKGFSAVKWNINETKDIITETSIADGTTTPTINFKGTKNSATITMYRTYGVYKVSDEVIVTTQDYENVNTVLEYTPVVAVTDSYDNDLDGVVNEKLTVSPYKVVAAANTTLTISDDDKADGDAITGMSTITWSSSNTKIATVAAANDDHATGIVTFKGKGEVTITMYRTCGLKKVSATVTINNLADYVNYTDTTAADQTKLDALYVPTIEVTDKYDNDEDGIVDEKFDTYDTENKYKVLVSGSVQLSEKAESVKQNDLAVLGNAVSWSVVNTSTSPATVDSQTGAVTFNGTKGTATIKMTRTYGIYKLSDEIAIESVDCTEIDKYGENGTTYTAAISIDDSTYDNDLDPATTTSEADTYYVVAESTDTLQLSEKAAPADAIKDNFTAVTWEKVSGDDIFTSVGTDGLLTFNGTKGTAEVKMTRSIGLKKICDKVTIINSEYENVDTITVGGVEFNPEITVTGASADDPATVTISERTIDAYSVSDKANGDSSVSLSANAPTNATYYSTEEWTLVDDATLEPREASVDDPFTLNGTTLTFKGEAGSAIIRVSRIHGTKRIVEYVKIKSVINTFKIYNAGGDKTDDDGKYTEVKIIDTYKDGAYKAIDVTSFVSVGYIYGGLWTDNTKTTLHTSETIATKYGSGSVDGTYIIPQAGSVFYVREVSNNYLRPKTISKTKYSKVYTDLVTAIDDTQYYTKAGFMADGITVTYSDNSVENKTDDNFGLNSLNTRSATKFIRYLMSGNKALVYTLNSDSLVTGAEDGRTETFVKLFPELTGSNDLFVCVPFEAFNALNIKVTEDDGKTEGKYITSVTFNEVPYFVTWDGVCVTGVTQRTLTYTNSNSIRTSGGDNPNVVDNAEYGSHTSSTNSIVVKGVTLKAMTQQTTFEPDKIASITKVYDDETKEIENVEKGNNSGIISYRETEGKLFAGWYADENFTQAADFSNVNDSMKVYAKYVSADFLGTYIVGNKTRNKITSITLVSAINNTSYKEKGFVIGVNGNEFKAVSDKYTSIVNNTRPYAMFGGDVLNTSKLFTYAYSTNSLTDGTKISVTPYWVTKDGTTVYGDNKTITYYGNAITE